MLATAAANMSAIAQQQQVKPNIILIVSDDTGYGDLGPYGGGVGRGMPTPSIDRLANEDMTFLLLLRAAELYARPRSDADRAHPNRSGLTTVAFQGQGGGLPAPEWTLTSVPKTTGYKTFFIGKWHLMRPTTLCPNRARLR